MNKKVSYPENLLEETGIQVSCLNKADVYKSIEYIIENWLDDESRWYIKKRFIENLNYSQIGKLKGISGSRVAQKINKLLTVFRLPAAVYYITYGFSFAEKSVKERITVWENESFEDFKVSPRIKFYHTELTGEIDALMQMNIVIPSLMVSYKVGACGTQSIEQLVNIIANNLMTHGRISEMRKYDGERAKGRNRRIFVELQKLGLMCGSVGDPVLLLPDIWKEKLQNSQEENAVKDIETYLKNEEQSIREEIEIVLRQMCAGRNYREWSESMIDKLYEKIEVIIYVDLDGQEDESVGRLTVTEDMVVTAMMMYMVIES